QCAPHRPADLEPWREGLRTFDSKTLARAREKEAERIADSSDVLRVADRLYLALSPDRLASLTDCRFGDGLKVHLYETYDEKGGFYVVATQEREDFVHTLVMKLTGKTFRALSWPAWSPDGKRFVHGRCDTLNRYDTAQIVRPVGGDLRVEATIDLPCEARNCAFAWESATSLTTTCHAAGQPAATDESFDLVRKDGVWTVVRD
ncbi:MAG TPA: hypothetical protein VEC60_10270, partial [Reyranella sp.]|nr:hypothetical protein [Reyranella sp.]